jgi:solute:Na+ symporter, SSS family
MSFDIDITIVAIYLIITLIVGIWKGRNIKSMQEYAVANRNYPVPILVATIAATWYGGGLDYWSS